MSCFPGVALIHGVSVYLLLFLIFFYSNAKKVNKYSKYSKQQNRKIFIDFLFFVFEYGKKKRVAFTVVNVLYIQIDILRHETS